MKNIINCLNKVLENRIRLGIMSALMVNESIDYNSLKELLDVTDGNLASHLKALEKNGMLMIHKQFIGRKPNTSYTITPFGRNSFEAHLEALEKLISNK